MGITQQSVLAGPEQPPVHSSSQHWSSVGPKHCPLALGVWHRSWQFRRVTKFQHKQCVSKNNKLNFGKCRPSFKILSLSDSWGHYVHIHYQDYPSHLNCVATLPCETVKITIAADFNGVLHVKPQNSSCKIWGSLNSSDLNHVPIKSGKQKRKRDASQNRF